MNDSQTILIDLISYIGVFATGIAGTIITTRILNKEVILTKRVFIQKIAYSSDTPQWGKIEVLYNGVACNNLHFVTVEIHNQSNKNIDDVTVTFRMGDNDIIYGNSAQYKQDEAYTPLNLTKEFCNHFLDVVERNKVSDELSKEAQDRLQVEISKVVRQRDYYIPVFNRRDVGIFSFLIANHFNIEPELIISIIKKDVRLAQYQEEEDRRVTQVKRVGIISLFVLLAICYPIYKFSPTVSVAICAMVINVFVAYYLSIAIYKLILWFKKFVS